MDPKYNDHPLYDNKKLKNCRDLHIEPDWVLIYKYSGNEIILLVTTGSHSEIFG
ncbi:MAG: type II toxin-antitoxin system YafQ family toxin [Firmicutes bacterium]|nr:type II toxin-antitoxin system YafQ family toxin [Bacillota bacterium]